jgi:hypothetical protein
MSKTIRYVRGEWPRVVFALGIGALVVAAMVWAPAAYHAPIGGLIAAVAGWVRIKSGGAE